MYTEHRNIYQNARQGAGLTQERAAELLGISVESVRAYETGIRIPPQDIVISMSQIYNTQFLGIQHMQNNIAIINSIIPPIREKSLPIAAISLNNRFKSFCNKHRDQDILLIAEDGKIDSSEEQLFEEIYSELLDIMQSILELKFSKQE